MATTTISVELDRPGAFVALAWSAGTDEDTGDPYELVDPRALYGAVQVSGGTVGSVTLQCSVDGTNWMTMTDVYGNDITITGATTVAEFTTAARYIRPSYGTGADATTVRVILRG